MKNRLLARAALLLLGMLALLQTAAAADLAREARIASQIRDAILEGEPVWLQVGEVRFLAIYTAAGTAEPRGAVVLLHGSDAHPDWADVIYPLRTALPAHGWATLSIQLPVTAPDSPPGSWQDNLPLAAPRISAAAAWLRDRQQAELVLVGHSLGARMGAEYLGGLHGAPDPAYRAFVAIGLTANPAETETGALKALSQIRLPVLDLYGERDLGGVVHSAAARRQAAGRAQGAGYTQLQVPGADHFFRGVDDLLISRVRAWLARTLVGDAAQAPASR